MDGVSEGLQLVCHFAKKGAQNANSSQNHSFVKNLSIDSRKTALFLQRMMVFVFVGLLYDKFVRPKNRFLGTIVSSNLNAV